MNPGRTPVRVRRKSAVAIPYAHTCLHCTTTALNTARAAAATASVIYEGDHSSPLSYINKFRPSARYYNNENHRENRYYIYLPSRLYFLRNRVHTIADRFIATSQPEHSRARVKYNNIINTES